MYQMFLFTQKGFSTKVSNVVDMLTLHRFCVARYFDKGQEVWRVTRTRGNAVLSCYVMVVEKNLKQFAGASVGLNEPYIIAARS